ncbi:sigma-70 family RNA polymerase sigma factor [Actinomycetospora flava]|uniref:Sigma-70 family RNA polymerase sigma factor n=1 Tax=Actinomycetospora flava TaxID=3129232 RepID=A0ABU8M5Z2_9PSEU
MRVSDASLAAAAPTNPTAFAAIYRRYGDALYDFCLGMLRDPDVAADCVQDVFCTAATRLGQLREHDKLRPWLYAIARHEALARLRGRRREQVADELPDRPSPEHGPEAQAAVGELAALVAAAAGGLSDRDRTVLELHYRHGLDGRELADALGVSATNANTLVSRLRTTVERCLGALLVARHQRNACPELDALLDGWDGAMTVLLRKRINRHIESCPDCADARRRLVSPQALLGAAPVMVPAPHWLEDAVTRDAGQLLSASSVETAAGAATGASGAGGSAAQAGWWPSAIGGGMSSAATATLPLIVAAVVALIAVPAVFLAVAAGGSGTEAQRPAALEAPGAPIAGVAAPALPAPGSSAAVTPDGPRPAAGEPEIADPAPDGTTVDAPVVPEDAVTPVRLPEQQRPGPTDGGVLADAAAPGQDGDPDNEPSGGVTADPSDDEIPADDPDDNPAVGEAHPIFGLKNVPDSGRVSFAYTTDYPGATCPACDVQYNVRHDEQVQVTCYVQNGMTPVGPDDNRLYYSVDNISRPEVGEGQKNGGYLNAHFVDDGMPANQPAPGVPHC